MTIAVDPLFTPAEDRRLLYQQRYRAEFVTLALWRIVHERAHWREITVRRETGAGGGVRAVGAGSLRSYSAGVFDVRVPAHARLGVTEHHVRLYRGELRRVLESLKPEERHALDEWLLKPRHSCVFRVHGDRVHRNEGAGEDLARAALKLMAATRVLGAEHG